MYTLVMKHVVMMSGTSGYQTGSTQMQFSEGPSLAPSDPSLSNLGDVSKYVEHYIIV